MHTIPYEQVKRVKWKGDSIGYDWALHALDRGQHDHFLVTSPDPKNQNLHHYIDDYDIGDGKTCIVWNYKESWVAKLFPKNWEIGLYANIDIEMPILKWEKNPNISPSVEFDFNPMLSFVPKPWDTNYELVWHVKDQDVWAFKCSAENRVSKGVKDMGELTPALPKHLDVLFISYHESNAEENWQRVLEKAPWARRVDGVEGIFNAHQAAAKLSTTDMFYVVDGDAWLVDDFNFDFQPGIFDRDCTHIWRARNPINRLAYGYGGVKLFAKQVIEDATSWTTLDMSTTIGSNLKVVNKISNITAFNTDEYSTWRSAFRECVKLCYNIHQDPDNKENIYRLEAWMSLSNQTFAQYAVDASQKAKEWVQQNVNDIDILRQINDRNWLEQEFNKTYNDHRN